MYGSLTFPQVLTAVLGRVPTSRLAHAHGWRAAALLDRPFPALMPAPGATWGARIVGLSDDEWRIMNAFEGPGYDLAAIELCALGSSWTYRYDDTKHHWQVATSDWDRAHFARHELAAYQDRCTAWRARYDSGDSREDLVRRFGTVSGSPSRSAGQSTGGSELTSANVPAYRPGDLN
nr:gamma-glutamylcyclotransferase family protein [Micromonospora matsumotoense]